MDEFAQTGAQQDDLFDDIQYDQPMQTRAEGDLFNDEIQPLPEQQEMAIPEQKDKPLVQEQTSPAPAPASASVTQTEASSTTSAPPRQRNNRGRGGGEGGRRGEGEGGRRVGGEGGRRGGGEGGRRGGGGEGGEGAGRGGGRARNNKPDAQRAPKTNVENKDAPSAPTTTAEGTQPTTTSVRGDRTATGGLRKPKLSEQELAEKMSRISLKNAALTAAHARAEADAASFAEREETATKRRQEERRDRQQMMGEREKNRLRKLKATGGREWDAEKPDDADAFGGQRQQGGRGRGAHGGVTGPRGAEASSNFSGDREDYTDGREYMYREDRGRGRGRGRGGRGGARGGANCPQNDKQQSQAVPRANDFPDLPAAAVAAAATPTTDSKSEATAPPPVMAFPTKNKVDAVKEVEQVITPGTEKKSWADMME